MNNLALTIPAIILGHLGYVLLFSSCTTQHQQELLTIGDKALAVAEATGQITPAQAAAARQAGKLLLTKDESVLYTPEPTK